MAKPTSFVKPKPLPVPVVRPKPIAINKQKEPHVTQLARILFNGHK